MNQKICKSLFKDFQILTQKLEELIQNFKNFFQIFEKIVLKRKTFILKLVEFIQALRRFHSAKIEFNDSYVHSYITLMKNNHGDCLANIDVLKIFSASQL